MGSIDRTFKKIKDAKVIGFKLAHDDVKWIDAVAVQEDCSRSDVLREAVAVLREARKTGVAA